MGADKARYGPPPNPGGLPAPAPRDTAPRTGRAPDDERRRGTRAPIRHPHRAPEGPDTRPPGPRSPRRGLRGPAAGSHGLLGPVVPRHRALPRPRVRRQERRHPAPLPARGGRRAPPRTRGEGSRVPYDFNGDGHRDLVLDDLVKAPGDARDEDAGIGVVYGTGDPERPWTRPYGSS